MQLSRANGLWAASKSKSGLSPVEVRGMTFQAVEAQIKELDTYNGFLDEFEQRCQSIKKGLCDVLQELKSTGNPSDPAFFQLERRFQIAALGTKKRLQERLRSMDRSALLHRRHVAQPGTGSNANSDSSQVDSLAADVTSSMARAKRNLREEIDKSILSYQIMERSTKRLQATNKKQIELGSSGVLGRTRLAMGELWRRERADQFWITAAFGVFVAAALYVLSQRMWTPPVMVLVRSGWDLIVKKHPAVLTQTPPVVLEEPAAMFTELHTDETSPFSAVEEPASEVELPEPLSEVRVQSAEEPAGSAPVIEPASLDAAAVVDEEVASLNPVLLTVTDSSSSLAVPEITRVIGDEPILAPTDPVGLKDPPQTVAATVATKVEPVEAIAGAPGVTVDALVHEETKSVDESLSAPAAMVDASSAVLDSSADVSPAVPIPENEPRAEAESVAGSSMEDLVAAETYADDSDLESKEDDQEPPLEPIEDKEHQSQLLSSEIDTSEERAREPLERKDSMEKPSEQLDPTEEISEPEGKPSKPQDPNDPVDIPEQVEAQPDRVHAEL